MSSTVAVEQPVKRTTYAFRLELSGAIDALDALRSFPFRDELSGYRVDTSGEREVIRFELDFSKAELAGQIRSYLGTCDWLKSHRVWWLNTFDLATDDETRYLQVLRSLRTIAKDSDSEGGHIDADLLLLAYIDDQQISDAYEDIEKWYA